MKTTKYGLVVVLCLVFLNVPPCLAEKDNNQLIFLRAPSGLEVGELGGIIQHQFAQNLSSYPNDDTFAVLNNGANTRLGVRYRIWKGLEVATAYSTYEKEKSIEAGYNYFIPDAYLKLNATVQYFNYLPSRVNENNKEGFFLLLAAQSYPIWKRLSGCVNVAYDQVHDSIGLGTGLNLALNDIFSLTFEYLPPLNGGSSNLEFGSTGVYNAGVKISWGRHQFMIHAGNTTAIETRSQMMGARYTGLFLGFTIIRVFDLL